MSGQLDGRVAVVTGGASGIGAATIRTFAAAGARVVIADLQQDLGNDLVNEIGRDMALFARTDVTKEDDVARTLQAAADTHGRLDIVFNNAGFGGALGPIDETSEADYDITFDVLVKGVFFGIKHAARIMKPQGNGNIINTASVAGLMSGYSPHLYAVAKAAVIKLTETTSLELAESGIRVNAICPGFIATPLAVGVGVTQDQLDEFSTQFAGSQPIGRTGAPSDIAEAALFLASDAAGFITGHSMVVDGGISAGKMWRKQASWMTKTRPIKVYRPPDR